MSRKKESRPRRPRNLLQDLDPYLGCTADAQLGIDPLAVGWLHRGQPFDTGPTPPQLLDHLLTFCLDQHTVCAPPHSRPCPLCGERPDPLYIEGEGPNTGTVHFGIAQIRVIGEDDIYAAPTLIHHYIAAHQYRPPDVFIRAILHGPQPASPEHRTLIRTLQRS